MGEASAVFGRITSYGAKDNSTNLNVVENLPSQSNGYSKFTKEMFNRNELHGSGDYTIGFARSYKNVESYLEEWIDEFEDILEDMKWQNVKVIIETEMYGSHQYFWTTKSASNIDSKLLIEPYNLIEKKKWYFGEGHRNFWGMHSTLGWRNDFEELRTLKTLSYLLDKSITNDVISTIKRKDLKQLTLKVNKSGIKSVISNLIKLYLDAAEKEVKGYTKNEFNIDNVFDNASEVNISKLDLLASQSDVKWINMFVDKLIEQKKGSL